MRTPDSGQIGRKALAYNVAESGIKYTPSTIALRYPVSEGAEGLSDQRRFVIFEALSHPTRVRILELIESEKLGFSSLKRKLGLESNGQLQHHMEKLSGLIETGGDGSYVLTWLGDRALSTYRESENSGRSLEAICSIPIALEESEAGRMVVGRAGSLFRLVVGISFASLGLAILISWQVSGALNVFFYGFGIGVIGSPIFLFLGVSYLLAGAMDNPGSGLTAIPNIFARRKYYMASCVAWLNLPNGRWLTRRAARSSSGLGQTTSTPGMGMVGRMARFLLGGILLLVALPFYFASGRSLQFLMSTYSSDPASIAAAAALVFGFLALYLLVHRVATTYLKGINKWVGAVIANAPGVAFFIMSYYLGFGSGEIAVLTYAGAAMFLAGWRKDQGCEVMSPANAILGNPTHFACIVFSPSDWVEMKVHRSIPDGRTNYVSIPAGL